MSLKTTFKVTNTPAYAADRALEIMRENIPADTNLEEFRIFKNDTGEVGAVAKSRIGTFHDTEICLHIRKQNDGSAYAEIYANDNKCASLVRILERRLG